MASSTVGVDIAVDPANTASCRIEWSADSACAVEVLHPAADADIVTQVRGSGASVGIDCALGWPDAFVEFLVGHRDGHQLAERSAEESAAWRRSLAYRRTDSVVREVTGRWPLSVSTDRLGLTAMRTAGLVSALARVGVSGTRAGEPPVFEVYPAAALRCWKLAATGYKASAEVRAELLGILDVRLPALDLSAVRRACIRVDHVFDALIAALATRSAVLGGLIRPTPEQLDAATREGWIVLPTIPLESLIAWPGVAGAGVTGPT